MIWSVHDVQPGKRVPKHEGREPRGAVHQNLARGPTLGRLAGRLGGWPAVPVSLGGSCHLADRLGRRGGFMVQGYNSG
jgi:hypothetical protein